LCLLEIEIQVFF